MSYSSVHITTISPYEHRDLVDFCEARNLKYIEEILISFDHLDETYRKPTKALKAFCGSEWADAKGRLTLKSAVQLILRTAKRLGLDKAGGLIELNENLQEILQTTETSILISTLPSRVNALLDPA